MLGRTFTFDPVHRTAGRRESETVDGLDELVACQLLREGDGEYRFSDEITRAAVYRHLSRQRHRLLRRRAGEALYQAQPDTSPEPASAIREDSM